MRFHGASYALLGLVQLRAVVAGDSSDDTMRCSNGYPGMQAYREANYLEPAVEFCCDSECDACYMDDCKDIWGMKSKCCGEMFLDSCQYDEAMCSETREAPCVVDNPLVACASDDDCPDYEMCHGASDYQSGRRLTAEPDDVKTGTCVPNTMCETPRVPGLQGITRDGESICCANGCRQCGGHNCKFMSYPLGADDCCGRKVKHEDPCYKEGKGPCVFEPCVDDDECGGRKICCPDKHVCEKPESYDPLACGDPHMTGFLGQKFDFTGEDGSWYNLISDMPAINVNMRVTTPVPGLPEITYITGLSVLTTDDDGEQHIVVITVKEPKNLESSCPTDAEDGTVSPCVADGALSIVLDGEEGLFAPGTAFLAPDVVVDAVNLPGACRSFGFEKYWEKKTHEYAQSGRKMAESSSIGEWILADPTATNMEECMEYVARAYAGGNSDATLYAYQSEHASFRISTPTATVRLSHGRLHQVAMRDPTDSYDLPEHRTWQMNVALENNDGVSLDAGGVIGQTSVPTLDANGEPIMTGMAAIRGIESDYLVAGPLALDFLVAKN